MTPSISGIHFTGFSKAVGARGLLARVSLLCDGFYFDGLELHRTRRNGFGLTWPCRVANDGRRYPVAEPTEVSVRRAVQAAVVAAWREAGGAMHSRDTRIATHPTQLSDDKAERGPVGADLAEPAPNREAAP